MVIQWEKQTRNIILVLLLLLTTAFAIYFKEFIKHLSISALMAYMMIPLSRFMKTKFGFSKKIATSIVFITFILLLIGVLMLVVPMGIGAFDNLLSEVLIFQDALNVWGENMQAFGIPLSDSFTQLDITKAISDIVHPQVIMETISFFTENIFVAFMILFVVYYLVLDYERLYSLILTIVPQKEKEDFEKLTFKVKNVWDNYLKGQAMLSLIIGVMTLVVCLVIGMPGTGLLVTLSLILTLVPSFGTAAMSFLAAATAAITGSNSLAMEPIWFGLLTLVLLQGVHIFEVYYLRPRVMEKTMNLHPAVVIIAVIASLSLSGVFLVLVIIPLLSTFLLLAHFVYARMVGVSPWKKILPE